MVRRLKRPQLAFGKDGARKRAAGSAAFDLLLALYGSCKKVYATDFCALCHYLKCCGVTGGAAEHIYDVAR
eukprot:3193737-Pyramimonas_sp.AAC.1